MKRLLLITFLALASCETNPTYDKSVLVTTINGGQYVPYKNNDFLKVDAKEGDVVIEKFEQKDCNISRGWLTIYKIDSSDYRGHNKYLYLANEDNTIFLKYQESYYPTNMNAVQTKINNLRINDKVYCVWGKTEVQNIKVVN